MNIVLFCNFSKLMKVIAVVSGNALSVCRRGAHCRHLILMCYYLWLQGSIFLLKILF